MNVNRINKIINRIEGSKNNKQENKNKKKILSTQDYVKKIRHLNEDEVKEKINRKTEYDQSIEEEKFRSNFDDLNVVIKFGELKIYDDYIFWDGVIDGLIYFTFEVTPYDDTSNVYLDYSDKFIGNNPDNQEIVDRLESYYNQFFKYWRDNIFETQ